MLGARLQYISSGHRGGRDSLGNIDLGPANIHSIIDASYDCLTTHLLYVCEGSAFKTFIKAVCARLQYFSSVHRGGRHSLGNIDLGPANIHANIDVS